MSEMVLFCSFCKRPFRKRQKGQSNLKRHIQSCEKAPPPQKVPLPLHDHQTHHLVVCLRPESFKFTIDDAPHLYIQVDLLGEEISKSAWFPGPEALRSFPNFHEEIGNNQVVLHQSLVTAFHLKHLSKSGEFTVNIREWNSKVFDDFPGDDSTKVTFLFLDTTDGDPKKAPEPWVQALQLKDRRHVNLYPSQREMEAEQGKVELIKVLDTIAKAATEWKFQFRPKTCFGTGICPLLEKQTTVYKRSWSATSSHVRIRDERLSCVPCFPLVDKPKSFITTKRKRGQMSTEEYTVNVPWFHQEYISLAAKGEFRVFLTPGSSSKGVVFHWVHTAVNRDNPKVKDIVLVTKPSGDDSVEFTANCITEEQLKRFALYYYERLRKLLPGMSFDDGVRLDIGASGDGRLWVIEVTPWYSAHYFSETSLPCPNTQVCKAFATSLARSLTRSKVTSL
ncbi:hypothetical protein M0657_012139 [Pyricularia oryzae]|nr:hypothetical protein M9X92_012155 [Pyricularia oryzae]KAI7908772.1 hypothetical protein M0657_012139 [Pyricularia oryzae]